MKQNFTVRQGALDGVEAFLSVAHHRSFRKAAAELGVTPSAISQAVRALEAHVGAALFIRTTRMTLFNKVFSTRTLVQIICVLGVVVVMKALSDHYDFSWAAALAAE